MPSRKSYNRFFIILEEDQKGYGLDSNKTPSGYAKLEVRNDKAKASFYVQNLKKQKGPYFMILIVQGKNDKELINLGQINIDDGGKADVSNEFDANNLVNTNIGMDKVQGAAIGKINGDKVMPVMVGFTAGEELKNWYNYPLAKSESNVSKENNNTTKPVKEAPKSYNENMNKTMPKVETPNLEQQKNNSGVTTNTPNKPKTNNANSPAPGVTTNESGNPMGSINPSMGDMNSNIDNLNKTLSNPGTMNINNPAPGTTTNESGNPMGSINPSMGDMNSNIDNLNKTLSNPGTMNINNPAPGVTTSESGNPMGSINPSMGDVNSNVNNPGNIMNSTMPNTRSDENYIEDKVEDKVEDEVDVIDIEECENNEPVVRDNLVDDRGECDDEGYTNDENKIFEEYEMEIERLKDYRKKHAKKKSKYDEDDCKMKNKYDEDHCNMKNKNHYEDMESNKEYEDMKSNKKYGQCNTEKHKKCEWNDKDYPTGEMGKFFKEVVYGLEKIGSNENIKNCFWYKAHVKKLEDMYCVYDYNKYSVVFYPMICYYPYISRHGNFMVGYKCDDEGNLKYIIYAIPGTRDLKDQPYEGKTGFVTFMPDENNAELGHWLMYYDIKGNTVVVPVKR